MTYRRDLWEIAGISYGVLTVTDAEDAGVPAVEVRKLAARGVLEAYGQGVYRHLDIPITQHTQLMIAVALAGEGAYLQRESVLDLVGIGHFNPPKIRVATSRRVRRALPRWMQLEKRADTAKEELTEYAGIPATSVKQALADMRDRIPPDRWAQIVDEALRRDLIDHHEVDLIAA